MSNVIPGFESLTKQQIFDMAAKHVLKNGEPSVNSGGYCSYAGIGCAAAPFLTPTARERLVGSWGSLLSERGRGNDTVPYHEHILISQTQECHDSLATGLYGHTLVGEEFIQEFKVHMRHVATSHGLNTFVLDETHRGE